MSMPKDSAIKPPVTETVPHAVSLAFLKHKGIIKEKLILVKASLKKV